MKTAGGGFTKKRRGYKNKRLMAAYRLSQRLMSADGEAADGSVHQVW